MFQMTQFLGSSELTFLLTMDYSHSIGGLISRRDVKPQLNWWRQS